MWFGVTYLAFVVVHEGDEGGVEEKLRVSDSAGQVLLLVHLVIVHRESKVA